MKTVYRSVRFHPVFAILIIAFIFYVLFLTKNSQAYAENPAWLSRAICLDLFLTIPLFWYLSIRKSAIPVLSVVPVFLACMYAGQTFLNLEGSDLFDVLNKNKIIFAECLFIVLESVMVYKIRKAYREISNGQAYSRTVMAEACYSYFRNHKIAHVMAQEFSIFYYLFARKKQVPANAFTYHQKSGKIMTGLFIGIISTETVAVHFLVAKWSVLTAWLLTISSAYVALALVAHYRASARLPILVTNTGMRIQNGLISSTVEIPFKAIKQIHQTTTSGILNHKKVLYVNSMNQLGNHNLVIELTGEFECVGLYGRKTAFNTLALELDDRNLFLATIKNKQLL